MQCSEVLELIEPIAAGDLRPDDQVRAHLRELPAVRGGAGVGAAARGGARRPWKSRRRRRRSPASVLQRIRRERWQSEQNVDRLFNVAIVAAVLLSSPAALARC